MAYPETQEQIEAARLAYAAANPGTKLYLVDAIDDVGDEDTDTGIVPTAAGTAPVITAIVSITQADFDLIVEPDENTLYVILEA